MIARFSWSLYSSMPVSSGTSLVIFIVDPLSWTEDDGQQSRNDPLDSFPLDLNTDVPLSSFSPFVQAYRSPSPSVCLSQPAGSQ